ncbi:MAG: serine kinase [Armatimonadetes bacterium]|nr:serine kinase [Armatimonadota bacterium]
MTVAELGAALGLTPCTPVSDREVTGAIVSDLLSDVLANGAPDYVWITIQTHRNVAAVASAQGLAAVILTAGRAPNEDLVSLAETESVTVFTSLQPTYTVAGLLYGLGVR